MSRQDAHLAAVLVLAMAKYSMASVELKQHAFRRFQFSIGAYNKPYTLNARYHEMDPTVGL